MDVLEKYSRLLTLLNQYMAVQRKVTRRASNPLFSLRHLDKMKDAFKILQQPYAQPTARQQALIDNIFVGQNTEDPTVKAAMSRAPMLALAQHYREELQPTPEELDQIEVLNARAETVAHQTAPRAYMASVLTVGTLVAKLVPKEVFEYFGWTTYGLYQTVATAGTIAIAIYLALVLIPFWLISRRRIATTELCGAVLAHMRVLQSRSNRDVTER